MIFVLKALSSKPFTLALLSVQSPYVRKVKQQTLEALNTSIRMNTIQQKCFVYGVTK